MLRGAKIGKHVVVFIPNIFLKNIIGFDVTVNYTFLMNKPNGDKAHCKSAKNEFFF